MKMTRRNAKQAEALNGVQKNDNINLFDRLLDSEEDLQECIGLLSQLFHRVDYLEQELTAIRRQLTETACRSVAERYSVLHNQSHLSLPPHRDGSRKKTAYLILEEDLRPVESSVLQNPEVPVRSPLRRRAVDEL